MGKCCGCLIIQLLFDDLWWFVDCVTENHKKTLVFSLVVGSVASAVFFWIEGKKLEAELAFFTSSLSQAEDENHMLRKRALTLRRQKWRLEAEVSKFDTGRNRAEEAVKKLKHKDSLARAEISALIGEINTLNGKVVGARRERDAYKKQLTTLLNSSEQPVDCCYEQAAIEC